MSIVSSESEFAPSCLPQHCRPEPVEPRCYRIVRAVCCTLLFAFFGVCFAIGVTS